METDAALEHDGSSQSIVGSDMASGGECVWKRMISRFTFVPSKYFNFVGEV